MPSSIGGRWLRELAERAAMGAQDAISGAGPRAIERVQDDIRREAERHRLPYAEVVRAVALHWERSGVVGPGASDRMARAMVEEAMAR